MLAKGFYHAHITVGIHVVGDADDVVPVEEHTAMMMEKRYLSLGGAAFPPNPKWKFGSHRMEEYAAATARVAREAACAYADVFHNWESLEVRKKPEDLLGNNINHPNDFGHWIYFRVLSGLGL